MKKDPFGYSALCPTCGSEHDGTAVEIRKKERRWSANAKSPELRNLRRRAKSIARIANQILCDVNDQTPAGRTARRLANKICRLAG